MPESENVSPSPSGGKRKSWKRRLFWGTAALFAAAALFHRPLLIWTLHTAAVRVARHEKVQLSLEIEGSILTNLTLKNLRGKALDGEGLSPIRFVEIEHARFDYSFSQLLRRGVTEFLTSYELRNASLVIEPIIGSSGKERPHKLTNLLRDILQQPALFSNRLTIENFNLDAQLPEGPLKIGGLGVLLAPNIPGFIRAKEIAIPQIAHWHDLQAEASYTGRRLIVGHFQLGDEIRVERLELDASRRSEGISTLTAKGTLFGGETDVLLHQRRRGKSSQAKATASVKGLSFAALRNFLRWKPEISGTLTNLDIDLEGEPDSPSSWKGDVRLELNNGLLEKLRIEKGLAHVEFRDGALHLNETALFTEENRLSFETERRLPGSFKALRQEGFEAAIALDARNLEKIHPGFTSGALTARGKLSVSETAGSLLLSLSTPGIALSAQDSVPMITIGRGEANLEVSIPIKRQPKNRKPWFEGLAASASASLRPSEENPEDQENQKGLMGAITVNGFAFDTASTALEVKEGVIQIRSTQIGHGENKARLDGHVQLPIALTPEEWAKTDLQFRFDVHAPSLASLNASPESADALRGTLSAEGEFQRLKGETRGHGKVEARDLAFREFAAKSLTVELPVEGKTARVARFELDLNGIDKLTGGGTVELQPPFAYEGTLVGKINDLSIFQPILNTPLGGSLQIDWRGTGRLKSLQHSGEGNLVVHKAHVNTVTGLEVEIAGIYSPEKIDLKTFRIHSDQGIARAEIQLADQRLQFRELRLEFGKQGVVTGQFSLPLDLTADKLEAILPETGKIDGQLVLAQVDLAKLPVGIELTPEPPPQQLIKKPKGTPTPPAGPQLRGVLDASLTAGGTVANPELALTLKGRDLHSRQAEKLQPAAIDASLLLKEARLVLSGEAKLPSISPLRFGGELPFDLRTVIREKRLAPETPLKASIKLPPSSAAILAQFSPQLRYVEGRISLDASARGTLAKPVFDGGLQLAFPAIRFKNADLPGINNLQGDLRFSGNQLAIRKFQGDAAGGPFNASGRVTLETWSDPQLDLRIKSQGTLLVRNDSVIVRTDSDLRIAGPLNSAKVSGKIGINKSRFFRDVDILPIGLPGRPTPQKTNSGPGQVSIDVAPVRNWTFDIAIRTSEPFIVRSNLAQGHATADLRLGGTGLVPTLEGTVRIENLVASLPFSRLEIDHGFARFTAADPFNPTLDIHGSSRLRDYNINVHIYGTAAAPETVFSSEPPLAQEEVIALLATGATTQEFTENNQVLAGRAGFLLLQDLYHKVVKKKAPSATTAAASPKEKPLLERFHLDVGTVDPRTGRQQVGGRFELSRQFEVGAGLDLEGDVKVQLRYLLRFR